MQRTSGAAISGWAAILLVPFLLPAALIAAVWPGRRTVDRTAEDVAGFIGDFIDGSGGEWDWDEFESVPITDQALNAIRVAAVRVGPRYTSADADFDKLQELRTRALALAQPVFVAEDAGPPRRRFWLYRTGIDKPKVPERGWAFVYDEANTEADWRVGWDTWEEWFFEIVRYPPKYTSRPLLWRRESNNEVVSLEVLQQLYDGKRVGPYETPESAGLRSTRT